MATTSGATVKTTSGAVVTRHETTTKPVAVTHTTVPVTGQAQLIAREHGATAGVTRSAGQTVFASSVAPNVAPATHRVRHATTRPAHVRAATAPSAATTRLEHGFSASPAPSLAAASAGPADGASNGLSTSVTIGLLILGVGLVGMTGGALVLATRPRRARSGRNSQR